MMNEVAIRVERTEDHVVTFLPCPNRETAEAVIKTWADVAKVDLQFKIVRPGKVAFDDLPEDVKEEVLGTLSCFTDCNVWYENGQYHVLAAVGIKASYGFDYFAFGNYKAKEIAG